MSEEEEKQSSMIIKATITKEDLDKLKQDEHLRSIHRMKRLFLFLVAILLLLVVLYVLLLTVPDNAFANVSILLFLIGGVFVIFICNEMTNYHHTTEHQNHEYKSANIIISNPDFEEPSAEESSNEAEI